MTDVIILTDSKEDMPHIDKITAELKKFDLSYKVHISSAHKSPVHLLRLLANYDADATPKVFITVTGRGNALSGMVDASVTAPVIACPPYSEKFNSADIFFSIRMPAGVAPALAVEPLNAALLAAKILGRQDKVRKFHEEQTDQIIADNDSVQ